MRKFNLQFFGGRGTSSSLPMSYPGGGGGGNSTGLDQQPGLMETAEQALGQRGRAMSVTSAVSGANPNYDLGPEYQENCQRCVIATEARLRGYDVQAMPTYDNDTMPINNGYLSNFVDPKTSQISKSTAKARQNEVDRQMASMGDGSRALMSFGWKGGGAGHVINVVRQRGKTRYYDGQNGTEVSVSHLFNAISGSRPISLTRVDNLSFSDTVNQAVRPHL